MNVPLKRSETFQLMAKALSSLTDKDISSLLANSTPISNSIGGTSTVVNLHNTPAER